MSNTLVVLLGIPGAGKSYFIKQKGLEAYTISPDQLRLLFSSPEQTVQGTYQASLTFEKQVLKLTSELVEKRLQRGELTVIDATHTKLTNWNKYKQLCSKYNTRLISVDFSSIDVTTAKQQNLMREEYKQVREEVIDKHKSRLDILNLPKDIEVIRPEEWDQKFVWPIEDFSGYKKIHHFGDIHGCYEPLKKYFKEGIKEDELYIFVGDYIDRGIQNAEVLNFLFEHMDKPNFHLLEGNHECHIRNFSESKQARSKEFERHTKIELESKGVSRKLVKKLCNKLKKAVFYTYGDKRVLVTHGGIVKIPTNLLTLSSEQMIRGVGDYNCLIDDLFTEHNNVSTYQIHGHRNIHKLPIMAAERSFNLEGGIEQGGHLRIVTLDKSGFIPIEIKNNVVSARYEKVEQKKFNNKAFLDQLKNNRMINEMPQKYYRNVSSFNFKEKVFKKWLWDKQTIKARGLFLNTHTTEIVSRSYDKFFNVGDREENTLDLLKEKLQFPINLFLKENGFLGITGYDTQSRNIVFSTKNRTDSKHANYFRDIFNSKVNLETEEQILRILRDNNLTFVFEVIDPVNDPHIIKYTKTTLILLDAIYREEHFKKLSYNELLELGKALKLPVKELSHTFTTWEEFEEWYRYKALDNFSIKLEGYVIEDQQGYMTKIKLPYYQFWKWMRAQVERINNSLPAGEAAMKHPLGNKFLSWYLDLANKQVSDSIIILREKFYNNLN